MTIVEVINHINKVGPKLNEIVSFRYPGTDYYYQGRIIGVLYYINGDVSYKIEGFHLEVTYEILINNGSERWQPKD